MPIQRPILDRRAARRTALLLGAALAVVAGCTDPIGVRPLPTDPEADPQPEPTPAAACEASLAVARQYAYYQGLQEFCFTPSAPVRVWDPLVPLGGQAGCACRGRLSP